MPARGRLLGIMGRARPLWCQHLPVVVLDQAGRLIARRSRRAIIVFPVHILRNQRVRSFLSLVHNSLHGEVCSEVVARPRQREASAHHHLHVPVSPPSRLRCKATPRVPKPEARLCLPRVAAPTSAGVRRRSEAAMVGAKVRGGSRPAGLVLGSARRDLTPPPRVSSGLAHDPVFVAATRPTLPDAAPLTRHTHAHSSW